MDQATGELVKAMKVSVIIPTYNGAHKIMNALRSLEKQTVKPDEVLVVIDGSTDGTAVLLREEKFNMPGFRFIEQSNGGRAKVRNRGAAEAKGDLLVFLDDDMIASAEWLAAHLEHHFNYSDSLMTGKFDDPYKNSKDEFWRFVHWLDKRWGSGLDRSNNYDSALQHPYLSAANFSISKLIFYKLDGFDERLTDAEDYDLATRAMKSGFSIYFSAKAIAMHDDDNVADFRGYITRLRRYAIAQTKLIQLKPELYKSCQISKKDDKISKLKRGIFYLFANRFWIYSIERGLWKWLPERVRFKLYDIVVTANGSFFPDKVTFLKKNKNHQFNVINLF